GDCRAGMVSAGRRLPPLASPGRSPPSHGHLPKTQGCRSRRPAAQIQEQAKPESSRVVRQSMNSSTASFSERSTARSHWFLLLLGLCSASGCVPGRGQEKYPAGQTWHAEIKVYEATEKTNGEPQPQAPVHFDSTRAPELTITVNEAIRYQRVEGFGASLTDS